jgi:hypothetical protein
VGAFVGVSGQTAPLLYRHICIALMMRAHGPFVLLLRVVLGIVQGRGIPATVLSFRQRREAEIAAYLIYDIVFNRTGVCFFIVHSQLGQQLEYALGFDFQLSSQLVNSNLHRAARTALRFPRFGTDSGAVRPF